MDRRGFLSMMVGGVATSAAVRTFPFRVFSFPKEIQVRPTKIFRRIPIKIVGAPVDILATRSDPISALYFTPHGVYRLPDNILVSREMSVEEAQRLFPEFSVRGTVRYQLVQRSPASRPTVNEPFIAKLANVHV